MERGSGILLHLSSIFSDKGIGGIDEAFGFIDFLHEAGQKYWQILPLAPLGAGNSPYQSVCAYAFDERYIGLKMLHADYLKKSGYRRVNFAAAGRTLRKSLESAFSKFDKNDKSFCDFLDEGEFYNYAAFIAIREARHGMPWYKWEKALKYKEKSAVESEVREHNYRFLYHQWTQYIFLQQWKSLRNYAQEKGIIIIGDLPIYSDYDSVECWENPEIFQFDEELKPLKVAGVPPDYFAEKGQLWGNPVYDWKAIKKSGYKWWTDKIERAAHLYDYTRIDHFRGFEKYYCISPQAKDATGGLWEQGPGMELFSRLKAGTGIIAEDLGDLDDAARNFISASGYPGMKVLQFAFGSGEKNPYLPSNFGENSIVYTGTHDNDTTWGWEKKLSMTNHGIISQKIDEEFKLLGYPGPRSISLTSRLIELAAASKAAVAIVPLQDYLRLDSASRMNTPGTVSEANWSFAANYNARKTLKKHIKNIAIKYKRY